MIVCICNALNDKTLAAAASEPFADGCSSAHVPTVGEVFRRCGERPQCGKCLTHVAQIIEETRHQDSVLKIAAE